MRRSFSLSLFIMIAFALQWSVADPILAQSPSNEQTRIAYVSNQNGHDDIYVTSQQGEEDFRIRLTNETSNEWNPKWSPDGSQILFNSDRDGRDTLYLMNSEGTNVRPVFPNGTANNYDGDWAPDSERIVFVSDRSGKGRDIYTANLDGSDIQRITDFERIVGDPSWSPDGQEILFWDQGNAGEIQLFRHNLASGQIARVTFTGTLNGAGVWSPDNNFVYYDTEVNGQWQVYRVQPDGSSAEPILTGEGNYGRVALSPDGIQIAFVTDRGESDEIYIMNVNGGEQRRLTENFASDHSPSWQPVVPDVQRQTAPTPEPIEETPEPTEESLLTVAVGASAGGVDTYLITKQRLLQEYGISAWHEIGYLGEGQRIGVIDTAFGGLSNFVESTLSLRDVQVRTGDSAEDYTNDNDPHGTQVIDIIHTIAPSAEIYACRYNGTYDDFIGCIDWLTGVGVTVINHSVGLPILPLDGNNIWAQAVNDTFQDNILWVNSAGNFDRGYYFDNFSDGNGDDFHDFVIGSGVDAVRDGLIVDIDDAPYTGKVILSWEEPELTSSEIERGIERINLDVNIVTNSGEVLNPESGRWEQHLNQTLPPYELVQLNDVQQPFKIQVLNNGRPINRNIRFAIFVEFADLEGRDGNQPSIVAPGDAELGLTVGAINGNNELASYSSRGQINRQYTKPQVVAPGEIILNNETNESFWGTSAAAPVVSGIAALLLDADPSLRTDELFIKLPNELTVDQGSEEYGRGIVTLLRIPRPIPRRSEGEPVVEAKTIWPQPEVGDLVEETCPSTLPSRLIVGIPGYVNFNLGLAMRSEPGGPEIETLQLGQRYTVINGPECLNGQTWWELDLDISGAQDGGQGWVAEAASYYFLSPINLDRAALPNSYENVVCPNALDPQLAVGDRGTVLFGNMLFFRDETRQFQNNILPSQGSEVHILGGPVCQGSNNDVLRWYVRVMSGAAEGLEGWLAEGDTDARTIEPVR